MRNKKLKFCTLLLLCLGFTSLKAQNAVVASGGNATGTNGKVSYSVGQPFYITKTGSNGSVADGVQQPYEIFVYAGIEEAKDIKLICNVYPNPTTEFIKLVIENNKSGDLFYQLYDMNGKLLANNKIEGTEASINMKSYAPATYFLKVKDNKKEVKTFKIIKN
jgi:hypothetical protein